MLRTWLVTFANDTKVHILLVLLLVDFILGVTAALVGNRFRLAYVADLLKNDLLGKVVPYFALYALALVAGSEDLLIPGLDFGLLAGAAYAIAFAALVGSILGSLRELGIGKQIPNVLAGPE